MRPLFFVLLCASTSLYGSAIVVTDPTQMTTNDVTAWSQFGPDQTSVGQSFSAGTNFNDPVDGSVATGSAKVVVACSTSSCGWQSGGGIANNDSVLEVKAGGTIDPLTLNFMPEYGVGTFIQAAGGTQFTARIEAFSGINSVLNTTVQSDANGDALFLGVWDTAADITRVVYSITSIASGSTGDFVIDKFLIQNHYVAPVTVAPPPVIVAPIVAPTDLGNPEPGTASLLALALLAFGMKFRKRLAFSSNR